MDWETFAERLNSAQSRLHDLRGRFPASSSDKGHVDREAVTATLRELDETLNELATAQEELRIQTEELLDARRELRDQRRRYRTLFVSAPAAYLVTTSGGVVRDANQQAGSLLRIRPRFLIGKPLVLFISPPHRRAFHERLRQLSTPGSSCDEWALAMIPRHGEPFDAAATIVSGLDPIENGLELQWVILDVTARRREERALQQDKAELEQRIAERTRALEDASRAKDEFLASLSHELRTPVNVIRGFAHMLKSGALDDQARARAIDAIERNSERQTRLVTDLLDVARINAGKFALRPRQTDLRAAIRAAEETAAAAEAKQPQIRTQLPNEPAWVWGDPERLQQVFDNLLSNAIKFTPADGRVWVDLVPDGSSWRVSVRDTGMGIAPAFMPSLFQRFRQAEGVSLSPTGGLGLGLSIVHYIMEMHGGSVTATSDGPGQGATFTCTLPRFVPADAKRGEDSRLTGGHV